jgi:hypothetical protein
MVQIPPIHHLSGYMHISIILGNFSKEIFKKRAFARRYQENPKIWEKVG